MKKQLSPDQQQQVKKAKRTLWVGIIGIVVIGLAIAVYFMFLKDSTNTVVNNTNNVTKQNINQVSGSAIDVLEAFADPEKYHNQKVCLTGYYQASFEFSAMGATFNEDENGFTSLEVLPDNTNVVWINVATPRYECPEYSDRTKACVQEMTLCGVFKIKGNGEVGFGHLGAYQYVLEPVEDEISNTNTMTTNTATTNTNSVSVKDCSDIDNYEECKARQDCNIIDDECLCATASDRMEKCGQDLPVCATCLGNNFAGCQDLVCDTNTNTTTNSNTSTTDTNTVSIKDCNDVITKTECVGRTDCLPVDICNCTTEQYWHQKCDLEQDNLCVCDRGGFAVCTDLDCDEEPINNKLLCQWQPDENSDCAGTVIESYYYDLGQGKCVQSGDFGPGCSSPPFYLLENCQNDCE
ncbi:hypothetical protein KKF61_06335 [Patescibacteria group bacterium]|nr:hypothetical protein [Patescibacteria group bacterium]MBU0964512.1 hypothetical protein [Patescibacteria group bacterium]